MLLLGALLNCGSALRRWPILLNLNDEVGRTLTANGEGELAPVDGGYEVGDGGLKDMRLGRRCRELGTRTGRRL